MARLPQVGGDAGNWGEILNEYLSVAHKSDGTLTDSSVDTNQLKVSNSPHNGNVLSWNGTNLSWATPATPVTSVAGRTGAVNIVKADVGLSNVDNTSDINKPISTAVQAALNVKVDTSSLATVATSGSYTDITNKPSIPVDNTLVHRAGSETISGNKEFTGTLTQNGNTVVTTTDSRLSNTRTPTDNSVGTQKLQDNAVTTPKIADGAITDAKLSSSLQAIMADTQTAATNAATSASNASSSANTATTAATNASSAQVATESARDETVVTVESQTPWVGSVTLTQSQSKSKYLRRLLTGNTVVTLAAGETAKAYSCTLELQQDTTGSRTIIFLNVSTPYGVPLPISTAANATDIFRLEWNGSQWSAFIAGPQMTIPAAWMA